jgi:hypothetical protein
MIRTGSTREQAMQVPPDRERIKGASVPGTGMSSLWSDLRQSTAFIPVEMGEEGRIDSSEMMTYPPSKTPRNVL